MRRRTCLRTLLFVPTLVVAGCRHASLPFGSAHPPEGLTLTDLHTMSDLQTLFNQDAGKPRLILLVSPT